MRPISDFPGYHVTKDGRVWSERRLNARGRWCGGKWLTPCALGLPGEQYLAVGMCRDGIKTTATVHRLVAQVFIPNESQLPQVNHIDGNTFNNNVSNLEWVTASENQLHKTRVLKTGCGETWWKSILTEHQVNEIRVKFKPWVTGIRMLAEEYGVSKGCITGIVYNTNWK